MLGFKKFSKTLPSKNELQLIISKEISDEGYQHFLKVQKKIERETVKDLQSFDLYLICDNFLLADVLEKFRNRCLEKSGFCPSLYVSAPALSWDIMFIMTKAEPELVSYDGMYFFTKKE